VLRNIGLERFMKRYNEAQELAPRDIVARAIVSEMHRTQSTHVYLDMTKKTEEFLKKRFPRIYETCAGYGLDLASDMAPVCPAAHLHDGRSEDRSVGPDFTCGSVCRRRDGRDGRTRCQPSGEQFPARRIVFGARAGQAMIEDAPVGKRSGAALPGSPAPMPENSSAAQKEPPKANSKPSPASATLTNIRDVMWREVGILRSGKELADAIKQLQALELPKPEKPGRTGHELRTCMRWPC